MMQPSTLRVIQLTPLGRGAVATLRIEGPGAIRAVQSQFRARAAGNWMSLPRIGWLWASSAWNMLRRLWSAVTPMAQSRCIVTAE